MSVACSITLMFRTCFFGRSKKVTQLVKVVSRHENHKCNNRQRTCTNIPVAAVTTRLAAAAVMTMANVVGAVVTGATVALA